MSEKCNFYDKLGSSQKKILQVLSRHIDGITLSELSNILGYEIKINMSIIPLVRYKLIQFNGTTLKTNAENSLEIIERYEKESVKKIVAPIKRSKKSYMVSDIQKRLIMGMLRLGLVIVSNDYKLFACNSRAQLTCVLKQLMKDDLRIEIIPRHRYTDSDKIKISIGYKLVNKQ